MTAGAVRQKSVTSSVLALGTVWILTYLAKERSTVSNKAKVKKETSDKMESTFQI